MKRSAIRFLLFTLIALFAPSATFTRMLAGEVVAVTDGDTITVREARLHRKIRLHCIDAPESDQ
jgi:endonuclease YncB( thermonuclease family)